MNVVDFDHQTGRDSGNDFRVPEIGSDNSRFKFILFSYPHVVPHVVPSRFSKQLSFPKIRLSFLELTRTD